MATLAFALEALGPWPSVHSAPPGCHRVQSSPCWAASCPFARFPGTPTSPWLRTAPTVSGGLEVDSRALFAPARCSRAVRTAGSLEGSPGASDSRVGRPLHRAAVARSGPAGAPCWAGRSAGANGCRRCQTSSEELPWSWHSPDSAWAGSAADPAAQPHCAHRAAQPAEDPNLEGGQGRMGV